MPTTSYAHEHLCRRAQSIHPAFRFDDRWRGRSNEWAQHWREHLLSLLGKWPTSTSPEPQWELLEEREDHVLHRVDYVAEPGLTTFAFVAVPKDRPRPLPAVLCLHGHGPFGALPLVAYGTDPQLQANINCHRYDFGRRFAQAGAVAFCPNLRGFGDRLTDHQRQINGQAGSGTGGRDTCNIDFFQRLWFGEIALTGQLHELKAAMQVLDSMPSIESNAIGCAGLSYGGRLTTFFAALEPRIKAAVVSGAMNSLIELMARNGSCGQQVVPGMLHAGDYAEVMGLAAPRPLAVEHGSKDPICPDVRARREFDRVREVYASYSASSQLAWFEFTGGHQFHGEASIPWMTDQLHKSMGVN